MLPARGPRPTLKGEETLTMRLMEDVTIPRPGAVYNSRDWRAVGFVLQTSDLLQRRAGNACATRSDGCDAQCCIYGLRFQNRLRRL